MKEEEYDPVDLSPLRPADEARWQRVVSATLLRVDALLEARQLAQDPLTLIASWRRPVLVAAGIAVAILVPVELVLEVREARAEQVEALVTLSAELVRGETPPSGADFLRALAVEAQP
jgi:hypothetical protein